MRVASQFAPGDQLPLWLHGRWRGEDVSGVRLATTYYARQPAKVGYDEPAVGEPQIINAICEADYKANIIDEK